MLIIDRVKTTCIPKEKLHIGDRVKFLFKDGVNREVTVQKIVGGDVLFIFEDCVDYRPIIENEGYLNKTSDIPISFETSDLYAWLQTEFLPLFPDRISDLVHGLSIPSYGMIFGHAEQWRKLTDDHDAQLELMKLRKNRLSFRNNEPSWYWLSNQYIEKDRNDKEFLTNDFVYVTTNGSYVLSSGYLTRGVRPIFYMQIK